MTKFLTDQCKGCGRSIVWGRDAEGRAVPLDPRPPVYRVTEHPTSPGYRITRLPETDDNEGTREAYMVSHFATCPKAAQFSGSRRPAGEAGSKRE